jgi:hypothetical protein
LVTLSYSTQRQLVLPAPGARLGARIKPLPPPHAHLQGTLLPRGFFLGLGLIYLAALAVDRLAANWRLPRGWRC